MNRAKTAARRGSVKLSLRFEIAPEDEHVTVAFVRTGIKQITWLDDGCPSACQVTRNVKFAHHVLGINTGGTTRHPGDQEQRLQVQQDMPRTTKHDRRSASQAMSPSDRHRCFHRAHTNPSVSLARASVRR